MKYRQKQEKFIVASLRVPENIYVHAMKVIAREDLDFSKLVRRALRRELENCSVEGVAAK